MRKIIPAIVVILLVLGFVLFSNLDSTVKSIIENAGTQALGTAVHVSGLDISLANETASMNGLSITNPQGFKAGDLLKTNSISITVGDVTNKTLTIKEIIVNGMTVSYEPGPNGTNIDALKRNLKSAPSPGSSGDKSSGKSGGGFDVIIQQLKIVHAQIIPDIKGFSGTVNLPDIVLNNIGSKGNPATPTQIATQIMNRVLASSSTAMLKSGLSAIPMDGAVGGAKNVLKGLLSQ